MVWQKNLRESLGIVAAIFLDESPGGSWRSCQDSLEFFCFIYVKSTLFSCVCQSHFRRPQGYFSCKFTRKTYFFSEQANTSSQNRNQFRFFQISKQKRALAIARALFYPIILWLIRRNGEKHIGPFGVSDFISAPRNQAMNVLYRIHQVETGGFSINFKADIPHHKFIAGPVILLKDAFAGYKVTEKQIRRQVHRIEKRYCAKR